MKDEEFVCVGGRARLPPGFLSAPSADIPLEFFHYCSSNEVATQTCIKYLQYFFFCSCVYYWIISDNSEDLSTLTLQSSRIHSGLHIHTPHVRLSDQIILEYVKILSTPSRRADTDH